MITLVELEADINPQTTPELAMDLLWKMQLGPMYNRLSEAAQQEELTCQWCDTHTSKPRFKRAQVGPCVAIVGAFCKPCVVRRPDVRIQQLLVSKYCRIYRHNREHECPVEARVLGEKVMPTGAELMGKVN